MSSLPEYTTEDLCKKVQNELGLNSEADYILEKIRKHDITESMLAEITLKDCKELCPDSISAVQLKACFNKLLHAQELVPEQELILTIKGLHQTVNEKLQEFQSNYSQLRLDLLEIVRRNSQTNSTPAVPHSVQQTPSQAGIEKGSALHYGKPSSPKAKSGSSSNIPGSSRPSSSPNMSGNTIAASTTPSSEPMKQLRASKEDSCEKVLKNAMKRHNLNEAEWKQHVLVICYGDQERVLELDEKPVQIFKALRQQGLHPAIMLRQRGDFEEVGEMAATPGGRL